MPFKQRRHGKAQGQPCHGGQRRGGSIRERASQRQEQRAHGGDQDREVGQIEREGHLSQPTQARCFQEAPDGREPRDTLENQYRAEHSAHIGRAQKWSQGRTGQHAQNQSRRFRIVDAAQKKSPDQHHQAEADARTRRIDIMQ